MRPARFERRAAPSPSFNYGWRLGVVIGASLVLLAIAGLLLALVGKVWGEWSELLSVGIRWD